MPAYERMMLSQVRAAMIAPRDHPVHYSAIHEMTIISQGMNQPCHGNQGL